MARRAAPALLAALALLAAGCGGGEGASAPDYRSSLNKLCRANQRFNDTLPQKQKDQALDGAAIQRLADAQAKRYLAKTRALEPPGNLSAGHDRLVKLLSADPPKSLDGALERTRGLLAAYRDLGAAECVKLGNASVRGLGGSR